jgi:hypothetical protein
MPAAPEGEQAARGNWHPPAKFSMQLYQVFRQYRVASGNQNQTGRQFDALEGRNPGSELHPSSPNQGKVDMQETAVIDDWFFFAWLSAEGR